MAMGGEFPDFVLDFVGEERNGEKLTVAGKKAVSERIRTSE